MWPWRSSRSMRWRTALRDSSTLPASSECGMRALRVSSAMIFSSVASTVDRLLHKVVLSTDNRESCRPEPGRCTRAMRPRARITKVLCTAVPVGSTSNWRALKTRTCLQHPFEEGLGSFLARVGQDFAGVAAFDGDALVHEED